MHERMRNERDVLSSNKCIIDMHLVTKKQSTALCLLLSQNI